MRRFSMLNLFVLVAAMALLIGSSAQAAITWGTPEPVTSASHDVTTGGAGYTVDRAYYFGNAANGQPYAPTNAGVLTISGITFTNFDTQVTDTKVGLDNIQNNTYGTNGQAGDYGLLMTSADWHDNGATNSLTFNNLHVGDDYVIGVWISDARQPVCCGAGRSDVVSSPGDPGATILFNQPAGPAGEYVYGSFVAAATGSQTLDFDSPGPNYQVNGVLLAYSVPSITPEPASIVVWGLVIAGGLTVARRRRKS